MVPLALALLFLAEAGLSPQDAASTDLIRPSQPSRILTASSRVSLGVPIAQWHGYTVCDASGDLVFDAGDGIFGHGPFLRIQSDGRSRLTYTLPKDAPTRGNLAWAITPDGVFYVLANDFKRYKLLHFKSDGGVDGETDLNIPPATDILFLAVHNNGTALVLGDDASPAPASKKHAGYAGVFDEAGRIIRDLSSHTLQVNSRPGALKPISGAVIAAEDGRFYLLKEQSILVINSTGTIEKTLKFEKPSKDAIPVRLDYSRGYISIVFHTMRVEESRRPAEVDVRAILLDAQTGQQQGNYRFDSSTTATVLCYTRADGYALLAVDGRMAAKDLVTIR